MYKNKLRVAALVNHKLKGTGYPANKSKLEANTVAGAKHEKTSE